ncbi:hypothetical protein QCA50_004708 [Cerrena zonata]|uniref:Uncharacterized protein n=1 Tax=Cerrena zonata TaxID=2478898 RepID=A0AAW0GNY8_9APHY
MQTEHLNDWVFISPHWWQLSYKDLSWAYRRRYQWTQSGGKAAIHPRPPWHHDQLYVDKDRWQDGLESMEQLELNPDLVGVRGALSTLGPYEEDVGISGVGISSHLGTQEHIPLLAAELDQDDFVASQKTWYNLVRDLMGSTPIRAPHNLLDDVDLSVKLWDLDLSDDVKFDSSEFVDHTDSELSTDSDPMPTTPHGDKKSYAAVVFDEHVPQTVLAPSPSKPLNATAVDFIPARTPLPESTPSPDSLGTPYASLGYEFHFPSLNAQQATSRSGAKSLPPNLRKDEYGFYLNTSDMTSSPSSVIRSHTSTRTATPKRQSTALLPAFLTEPSTPSRTRQSKTREIVDRLRSATASGEASRQARKPEPDLTPTGDEQMQPKLRDIEHLSDRMAAIDGWITNVIETEEAKATEARANKDGWIEGTAIPSQPIRVVKNKKSHKRSSSSVNSTYPMTPPSTSSLSTHPSPASSLTSFGLPVTPTSTSFPSSSYYPYPTPYTNAQAAYMQTLQLQMQAHAQAQAQWQMQMSGMLAPSFTMFQGGVVPAYSMPQPIPVYEGGKITGSSGIRHV